MRLASASKAKFHGLDFGERGALLELGRSVLLGQAARGRHVLNARVSVPARGAGTAVGFETGILVAAVESQLAQHPAVVVLDDFAEGLVAHGLDRRAPASPALDVGVGGGGDDGRAGLEPERVVVHGEFDVLVGAGRGGGGGDGRVAAVARVAREPGKKRGIL